MKMTVVGFLNGEPYTGEVEAEVAQIITAPTITSDALREMTASRNRWRWLAIISYALALYLFFHGSQ